MEQYNSTYQYNWRNEPTSKYTLVDLNGHVLEVFDTEDEAIIALEDQNQHEFCAVVLS